MNIVDALVWFCRDGTDNFIRENGHQNETQFIVISMDTFYALLREWTPLRETQVGPPPTLGSYRLYHPMTKEPYRMGIYEFFVSDKPEVTTGIAWPKGLRKPSDYASVGTEVTHTSA